MLRDRSLIPLSHQHQHALALCVRIDRAQPIAEAGLEAWQAEIEQIFDREIRVHFCAEERVVFPEACRFPELVSITKDLTADHESLRRSFFDAQERRLTAEGLAGFAQTLSTHIRKEERELFENLQRLMTSSELADLGSRLEVSLRDSVQVCSLIKESNPLKP